MLLVHTVCTTHTSLLDQTILFYTLAFECSFSEKVNLHARVFIDLVLKFFFFQMLNMFDFRRKIGKYRLFVLNFYVNVA